MDWLSDFGWWLFTSPTWGLLVGAGLIWGGLIAAAWMLISRYGDVRLGPDPVRRPMMLSDSTTVIVPALPVAPNYHRQDPFIACADMMREADELADAIADVIPIIESTVDYTELVDYSTPLFYEIRRRPTPVDLETFTESWTTAEIAQIREAKP